MKILNTLEELWTYCEFCPICQEKCRIISAEVGPDDSYKLVSIQDEKGRKVFTCQYYEFETLGEASYINFIFNIQNNTVEFDVIQSDRPIEVSSKVYNSDFFFYINADCRKCSLSNISSADIEVNLNKGHVTCIGIEREAVYFVQTDDKYHLAIYYDEKPTMQISQCIMEQSIVIDVNKVFRYPLIKLDLNDQEKCVNRLKTLLVFS